MLDNSFVSSLSLISFIILSTQYIIICKQHILYMALDLIVHCMLDKRSSIFVYMIDCKPPKVKEREKMHDIQRREKKEEDQSSVAKIKGIL